MSMAEANSRTFYRTILLLSFVAFVISFEAAKKHDKYVLGGEDKKDRSSAEWLEPVVDRASKKMLGAQAGYVYIIAAMNGNDISSVKIGYSSDPAGRRTQLQVGNPLPLVLSNMYEVTDMVAAEDRAKTAMHNYLIRGEWFSLPPAGITSVRRIVSTAIGPYKVRDDTPRKNV